MSLSYLQTSLDRIAAASRDDIIEICINPDGTCWGEFQGDHFMRALEVPLTPTEVRDLGNQIASGANTTLSKDRPIVSVSITYRDRPIRAQVITPPAVHSAMSISLRFFSSLPLEGIELAGSGWTRACFGWHRACCPLPLSPGYWRSAPPIRRAAPMQSTVAFTSYRPCCGYGA